MTKSFRGADGTAETSDSAITGTKTFATGETTKTITITVNGDNKKQSNETFSVDLFGTSRNSLFTKNRGVGKILNDVWPGSRSTGAAEARPSITSFLGRSFAPRRLSMTPVFGRTVFARISWKWWKK